tara:strand:+ start:3646 stop:4263 length:618 start_codon:yes stop_codon:yes gene_type:complete
MDTKKQRNISSYLKSKLLILSILIFTNSISEAKDYKSIFNFNINIAEGYKVFNRVNLYDLYNHSTDDPSIKRQLNYVKKQLQNQNIEMFYNFSESPVNNITILVFNDNYKVTKKNVLKQCNKILKIERKIGKRKVKLKECRMLNEPTFADWSMYRENESSFVKDVITQQIIFLYKKKEYVFTSTCWHKCIKIREDLFNFVKSIKF